LQYGHRRGCRNYANSLRYNHGIQPSPKCPRWPWTAAITGTIQSGHNFQVLLATMRTVAGIAKYVIDKRRTQSRPPGWYWKGTGCNLWLRKCEFRGTRTAAGQHQALLQQLYSIERGAKELQPVPPRVSYHCKRKLLGRTIREHCEIISTLARRDESQQRHLGNQSRGIRRAYLCCRKWRAGAKACIVYDPITYQLSRSPIL
jgi:hypothetical protein